MSLPTVSIKFDKGKISEVQISNNREQYELTIPLQNFYKERFDAYLKKLEKSLEGGNAGDLEDPQGRQDRQAFFEKWDKILNRDKNSLAINNPKSEDQLDRRHMLALSKIISYWENCLMGATLEKAEKRLQSRFDELCERYLKIDKENKKQINNFKEGLTGEQRLEELLSRVMWLESALYQFIAPKSSNSIKGAQLGVAPVVDGTWERLKKNYGEGEEFKVAYKEHIAKNPKYMEHIRKLKSAGLDHGTSDEEHHYGAFSDQESFKAAQAEDYRRNKIASGLIRGRFERIKYDPNEEESSVDISDKNQGDEVDLSGEERDEQSGASSSRSEFDGVFQIVENAQSAIQDIASKRDSNGFDALSAAIFYGRYKVVPMLVASNQFALDHALKLAIDIGDSEMQNYIINFLQQANHRRLPQETEAWCLPDIYEEGYLGDDEQGECEGVNIKSDSIVQSRPASMVKSNKRKQLVLPQQQITSEGASYGNSTDTKKQKTDNKGNGPSQPLNQGFFNKKAGDITEAVRDCKTFEEFYSKLKPLTPANINILFSTKLSGKEIIKMCEDIRESRENQDEKIKQIPRRHGIRDKFLELMQAEQELLNTQTLTPESVFLFS